MKKRRRRKWKALQALSLVSLIALGGYGFLAAEIVAYPERATLESVRGDAALVLGAATASSAPSPVFRARIDHALALYRAGRVRKLLFTGGQGVGEMVAESDAARGYALAHGIPARDILQETRSRTTEENLRFGKQVGDQAGLHRLLLVSDPLHLKRAMAMATDMGLDITPSPTPYTRYRTWRTRLPFALREAYEYTLYQASKLNPR